MTKKIKINGYIKLVLISFVALILDYIWLVNNQESPPGWDQGYHLSNTFKMYNILESKDTNFINKFASILDVSDNYRGPLTYLISAFALKLFNNSYLTAYLSNNLFNFISVCSIYNICKLFNLKTVGIWASLIYTFSPFIFFQRTDYLIDSSLTAFSLLFLATLK